MACKRSAVRSCLSPPQNSQHCSTTIMSPSSRGLGHRPFTAVTGVRIPVGTPKNKNAHLVWAFLFFDLPSSERTPSGSTKHMPGACAWTRGDAAARSRSDAGIGQSETGTIPEVTVPACVSVFVFCRLPRKQSPWRSVVSAPRTLSGHLWFFVILPSPPG